jgi:thiamine pyrophosphate-dependent acetolactate synthase large subunit-like protein
VKRCYGIVGDALNPVIDALHRNGKVEFVHVRNEEYGVFAAVAEAYFTGNPVAVCGTAGPGVTHLFNGLMDAKKEGAPVACARSCGAVNAAATSNTASVSPAIARKSCFRTLPAPFLISRSTKAPVNSAKAPRCGR